MACVVGCNHTITLSGDSIVHSFGKNHEGQLGLGHFNDIYIPTPITSLPKIKGISCGWNYTICIDFEGSLWSFGENYNGQLGIGNTIGEHVPQKIKGIPPVLSVSCGYQHTLIITNDSNADLWSCGSNSSGQLCLGNKENQSIFKQTSFSNISKVSLGQFHSLFQNEKGEIFSCGKNECGELGLGHFDQHHGKPTLIPNLPSNIVQFVSGFQHNLFLDSDGNVFSMGFNGYGQLGLSHSVSQNLLNQISNIPPIRIISCVGHCSYLIDFEGNVWSFGYSAYYQLGHDDRIDKTVPTKINNKNLCLWL